ncbi:glycosyl transferase [Brachybacterium endophyticum]|uniref:Glycosyl transferase n=1 Tax=Brachybacterium endophyticum TaxID=2182385 RepID=A0A2U2RL14_9MICO|nr:CDP-glycerol glycerophosphotransferase family protein [Brachybacterium endophyticum]PWH06485.1 glycosyl transferase [Brachybacterium endophyticum]
MAPRGNSLKRRVRSTGGRLLRRFGLLPGGVPDGLGDDDRLTDTVLEGDVVLYFPDTLESLYQLRDWFGPLKELHARRGVTIICMDSRVAARLRDMVTMPVITVARDATLDALILRSSTRLILYVNYNPLNTAPLRSRSALHVSLLHGDSDKGVSVSNQIKAYDFSFVAGQAAIDRIERYSTLFDARTRCIPVGRPSLDTDRVTLPARPEGSPPAVLYAPTWEGGQASVAYSSLTTQSEMIVHSLLAAGLRVIYRPHPLTGVRLPEYGEADARLRELLVEHGQEVSEGHSTQEDFARADLMICDVSAVATDWLSTRKPLIVTRAASPEGPREAATRLLQMAPRLSAQDAPRAGEVANEQITEDPLADERRALTEYYLGDTTPGASLERFLKACDDLAVLRDELWASIQQNQIQEDPR